MVKLERKKKYDEVSCPFNAGPSDVKAGGVQRVLVQEQLTVSILARTGRISNTPPIPAC